MSMKETTYEMSESLTDVRQRLDEVESIKIIAGGQSLTLLLRQNLIDAELFLDISEVPELGGVEEKDDRIVVNATTTYEAADGHPVLAEYGSIQDAIGQIADQQVRNMGTIGGAVSHCDPSLDIIPPLLCRDARVHVGSVDGTRTVPLAEFAVGFMETDLAPNELVEAVSFEKQGTNTGSAYEKHSNIKGGWATVGVGAEVTLSDDGTQFSRVRVALAAVGDTTIRATSVEEALENEQVSRSTVSAASENVTSDIDPLDDISGSRTYKERLAEGLTNRTIQTAIKRAGGQ